MNCRVFRKRMVELLDTSPGWGAVDDMLRHADECTACAGELAEARSVLSALSPSHEASASADLKERIMSKVSEIERKEMAQSKPKWLSPKLALAGVFVLVLVLSGGWFVANSGRPSAFIVLAQAAEIAGDLRTVHITARMRTRTADNFDVIDLSADLVPMEMWKSFEGAGKWRIEKPRRVVVMDGDSVDMLISPGGRSLVCHLPANATGVAAWLYPMLDVPGLLARERAVAREDGSQVSLVRRSDKNGRPRLVLTVQAGAKGDFSESDYLKNSSIWESENKRTYIFDADTLRLEGLQVYVNTGKESVLVFEITGIEYDTPPSESLFKLEVPDDAIVYEEPTRADGDNSSLTPRQAAEAIFSAMADEDWSALRAFAGSEAENPDIQEVFGGLKIKSIGKPFKSGLYPGWFVPYEVQLRSGQVRKMSLAIRNDNPEHRWLLDGGY